MELQRIWTRSIPAILLLLLGCLVAENSGTQTEIKAEVGSSISLPCRVDASQCGDLHSVKWYRDSSRIYVFSQVAGIARAEGDATSRMTVEYATNSTDAFLTISPVAIDDEASYKCEITYLEVRENCDVVQLMRLKTTVKPESVQILGSSDVALGNATMFGPFSEGTEVVLVCQATRAKPVPNITWYNGTDKMSGVYSSTVDSNGIGSARSKLQVTLTRGDLNSKFECKVDSEDIEEPIVAWLKPDVNVRPLSIDLSGVKSHVVQGTNVLLICVVHASKPHADVRWFNGSDPIPAHHIETTADLKSDGTFETRSELVFEASQWENGRAFVCEADNPVMKENQEPARHKTLHIEVFFPPIVTVSPENITKNEFDESVLLTCRYIANPQKLDMVTWSKNGQVLSLTDERYEGGNAETPPLKIKNVTREDMGKYTCTCANSVGSSESETEIFLNVQYPPIVEVTLDPSTPVLAKDKSNVTLNCNVVSGNPRILTKVQWFMFGELLKELPECNYTTGPNDEQLGDGGPFCTIDPSVMYLTDVNELLAGNYSCLGENAAGWGPMSEDAEVVVYYPPTPAKVIYYPKKVIKKAAVTLECSVDDPGKPELTQYMWYRGAHLVPDITTANWTISPVTLETESNFTCIAYNEGGQSVPATVEIDVSAPPDFIQKPQSYQGVLVSSKNISLSCRVECAPLCSVTWHKDGKQIELDKDNLYSIHTVVHPKDYRTNDFESIESTLIWNMTAWPGEQLDRTANNSIYECKSSSTEVGHGVQMDVEIAVDYPPENITVSNRIVNVVENHIPEKVVCSGKGRPKLSYLWRRNMTTEPVSKDNALILGAMPRGAAGYYICEATNKHGTATNSVYLNVMYKPECAITQTEMDGSPALLCTANANPKEVTFTWRVKGMNDTQVEGSYITQKGLQSYLVLDSSVDTFRTYLCYANNSVGVSIPCERDVAAYQEQSSQVSQAGTIAWWKRLDQDNLLILIAIIVGIIICVLIICIIIIIVCKRKRASNKYNSPVELEEREKPDGQSPDTSSQQAKWPLKPGVLVHVNTTRTMNKTQFSQLTLGGNDVKYTAGTRIATRSKHRTTGVRARLLRLSEILGLRNSNGVPAGIYHGASGVVTFKKISASAPRSDATNVSRKRKKPGQGPNPSGTGDKGPNNGFSGGSVDPLTEPDKGFYENLPFHGMQNPPNKPISIIAPFIQGNKQDSSHNMSSSTKSLLSSNNNSTLSTPHNSFPKRIQRNQSFHGFQDNFQVPNQNYFHPFVFGSTQSFCTQHSAFSNFGAQFGYGGLHNQKCIPSIFANLPSNFNQITGNNTVAAIRFQQSAFNPNLNRVYSSSVLPQFGKHFSQNVVFNFSGQNPFSIPSNKNKSTHKSENTKETADIRRTASGINLYPGNEGESQNDERSEVAIVKKPAVTTKPFIFRGNESSDNLKSSGVLLNPVKRFNSLEIKKHRCYSPTFYSMRCKKHAKRRTVLEIQPLPKKLNVQSKNQPKPSLTVNEVHQNKDEQEKSSRSKNCFVVSEIPKNALPCSNLIPSKAFLHNSQQDASFQHLTDSIQILEQSFDSSLLSLHNSRPKPAPRNRKSNDHIYQNITVNPDGTPVDSFLKDDVLNIKNSSCDSATSSVNEPVEIFTTKVQVHNSKNDSPVNQIVTSKDSDSYTKDTFTNFCKLNTPNLCNIEIPFSPPPKIVHTNLKPLTESPKGALFQKLHAKTKSTQNLTEKPSPEPKPVPSKGPLILKPSCRPPDIPKKPDVDPKQLLNHTNPSCQNAFYTLTPNIKRLTTHQEAAVDPRHFASTLPPQRHMKLMPKALFQDQQVSKSKSFSSRTKHKKHFQIPLQKCHSFKLQTAESYFQPIKSIHEENYLKNGYAPDMGPNFPQEATRSHKRDKHKQQKGPLVLRRPGDYDKEDMHFHENMQNAVKLQYPQPMYGQKSHPTTKVNGIVYADLDMPKANKKSDDELSNSSRNHKSKGKTEYATLKFNDVGQEIDV